MIWIWSGLWFGYSFGYDFDMVWERSGFFRVPDGLAWKKETETATGQAFGRFREGFYCLIRFRYGFDKILRRFCCGSDLTLICVQNMFKKSNNTFQNNITFDPQQNYDLDRYRNQGWNHIKVITAKPQRNHNTKSYLNHINIIEQICWTISILEASEVIILYHTLSSSIPIFMAIAWHLHGLSMRIGNLPCSPPDGRYHSFAPRYVANVDQRGRCADFRHVDVWISAWRK